MKKTILTFTIILLSIISFGQMGEKRSTIITENIMCNDWTQLEDGHLVSKDNIFGDVYCNFDDEGICDMIMYFINNTKQLVFFLKYFNESCVRISHNCYKAKYYYYLQMGSGFLTVIETNVLVKDYIYE